MPKFYIYQFVKLKTHYAARNKYGGAMVTRLGDLLDFGQPFEAFGNI